MSSITIDVVNVDSLKKRYAYKLITNIVNLGINVVVQAIIPRGLGPRLYGDFTFLTNFFSQVVGFADMGSSTCFYTKLSQRPSEQSLVAFYSLFAAIVFGAVMIFVTASTVTPAHMRLWPDQSIYCIYLAAGAAIICWIVTILGNMADSYGITVSSEKLKMAQKVFGLLIILSLFYSNRINLINVFYYQYLTFGLVCVGFVLIMKEKGYPIHGGIRLQLKGFREYAGEFYKYCNPLFFYSMVSMLVSIFDRWLLQLFGGGVEQGYFGLAFQLGAISMLFTGALTPLFMREMSISHGTNDYSKMSVLYARYIPLMVSLSAFFACFVTVHVKEVIKIMGGTRYGAASMAVAIMAFYPVCQTYGQLCGSVFYATGKTRLYSNMGIMLMLIGLPVTYVMIAPGKLMGFNAGSAGLAVKTILMQIVGINIMLYYNARMLRLSFARFFIQQPVIIGSMLVLSLMSSYIVKNILSVSTNAVMIFIFSGIFYTLLVAIMIYSVPVFFGLNKQDIRRIMCVFSKRADR